jgi:hypothetical protein
MNLNLKLVFIPVWLEKMLEACNESLATALEPEKLTRILSSSDLDLYGRSQLVLSSLLPHSIYQSFHDLAIDPTFVMDDEEKRGYLYGFLPDTDHLPAQPNFRAHHVGYDYVVVTVDTEQKDVDFTYINLMEVIIEILSSVRPLESVAKLPIMAAWLKATAKNSVL